MMAEQKHIQEEWNWIKGYFASSTTLDFYSRLLHSNWAHKCALKREDCLVSGGKQIHQCGRGNGEHSLRYKVTAGRFTVCS